MDQEGNRSSILKKINEKTRKAKRSRYSVLIYILTIFIAPIWIIFFNPCIMNIVLPILAILIPYKLYDENDLKKLLVVGIVAIILLGATMGFYHTTILYDQPSREIRSERRNLTNGTIDPIYGTEETVFNFTVELNRTVMEEKSFELYTNLSYVGAEGVREEHYEGYEMIQIKNTTEFYIEIKGLEERLFNHRFTLFIEENDDYIKERTSLGFGPVTLDRTSAFGMITLQQSLSTTIVFLLLMGVLWLKKRMDKSLVESTEGLEEKEEELEDYCPDCGHLLEGKKECDRCGWIKQIEEEIKEEENELE